MGTGSTIVSPWNYSKSEPRIPKPDR
jgi:hypothetical protein